MEIITKAAQLILSLSILVTLHELGHFIPAKLFGCRVDKFYLFFDPWFSLFKRKKGDTEYGIGWLPLGGYVKIAGMIDESMDKESLNKEPQPWEFRSKPAWQRLIIMLGGVTVNLILGFVIYAGVLWYWGEEILPTKAVKYGITADSVAIDMGLRSGDKIFKVDNKEVISFNKIPTEIIVNQARTLEIERDGKLMTLDLPRDYLAKLIKSRGRFISPRIPYMVSELDSTGAGFKAGLKPHDKILAINEKATSFVDEGILALQQNVGKTVALKVLRSKKIITLKVEVPASGKLGFAPIGLGAYYSFEKKSYSLLSSIPEGFNKAQYTFSSYLKQLKLIVSPEVKGYKQVGGFITLGSAFAPTWDWEVFWLFTAFFSIALCIMNLLPIPALDGGHVLFTLYEIITRRKPGEKFLEYAQISGMVILLGFMLMGNINDILRLIGLK